MAIKQWQNKGDLVLLMADMDEDVRTPLIKNTFRMVGLVEGLTTQHPRPPPTHNRGSNPIDGIFIPISLIDQCQTGYLEFGKAIPSNHRALWIDMAAHNVCSMEPEPIECPKARRLQCRDPRIIERYNTVLWENLQRDGMAEQVQHLVKQITKRISQDQQKEYEIIDRAAREYK